MQPVRTLPLAPTVLSVRTSARFDSSVATSQNSFCALLTAQLPFLQRLEAAGFHTCGEFGGMGPVDLAAGALPALDSTSCGIACERLCTLRRPSVPAEANISLDEAQHCLRLANRSADGAPGSLPSALPSTALNVGRAHGTEVCSGSALLTTRLLSRSRFLCPRPPGPREGQVRVLQSCVSGPSASCGRRPAAPLMRVCPAAGRAYSHSARSWTVFSAEASPRAK